MRLQIKYGIMMMIIRVKKSDRGVSDLSWWRGISLICAVTSSGFSSFRKYPAASSLRYGAKTFVVPWRRQAKTMNRLLRFAAGMLLAYEDQTDPLIR
jgi:hypothetical protein